MTDFAVQVLAARSRVVVVATSLAVLAAALAVAGWLWDPALSKPVPWLDLAITAVAFAVTLLACCTIAGLDKPAAHRVPPSPDRRTEAFLVATAIATGVILAALQLDGFYVRDETQTLRSYVVNQPLAVAAGKYNNTNNHVLHTVLVWTMHQLGNVNRVVLRLPAFLSYCLFLPALWWFVRREHGPRAAVFATAFASASPYFLAHATVARGYTLLLLFFAVALLCGQELVRNPNRKELWAIWAAAIALGFYAIPLMAYPAATTATWMLLSHWRRFGRDGLGVFAARTAAWLAVAATAAGILYLPVLKMMGLDALAVLDEHRRGEELGVELSPSLLAMHPIKLWRHWHIGIPAWTQGALLALMFVGAAVADRTSGRRSMLLLAMGLATGTLWLPLPFLPESRMMIWVLVVLMILAGTGTAFVLERTAVRVAARWPGIVADRSWRALQWGVLMLVLGTSYWWATKPGVRIANVVPSVTCSAPASWWCAGFMRVRYYAMAASAVVDRMRPKDYFAACTDDGRLMLDIAAVIPVDQDVGEYSLSTSPAVSWAVHGVSTRAERGPERALSLPREEVQSGQERLFVFETLVPFDEPGIDPPTNCIGDAPLVPMDALLETSWPNHELVAAFAEGRVYVLNNRPLNRRE